jgi:adenylate cyclase
MSGSNASDLIGKSPDRRKLIAVVYADMVGYSRLIGLDDAGTLERLRTLRRNLIDRAIEQHGGRIVQTGGDSLLIVFDSIDGAVRCAVEVQQQVPILDRDQPPDRAIRFRVGINIGDAIADGTDLHGDAVNVAARLQAECPPGSIYVSRSVHDHVHGRLDLAFEGLGALNLKNIARPVEAFVLRLDDPTNALKAVERSLVHNTGEALPLPDRPSIAVLAFTNMSGDPEQEYFSDGIADDIITELSHYHWLFVIARNSSFTYKGHAVHVKQVARDLGVRYILEGSVRRSGDRVRVTAQLIEAETGSHIWAQRYDRSVNEVFAVQDEITTAVTSAILPAVTDAEQRRALRKPPESLGAWEAYQRGLWYLGKGTATENERAKEYCERAIALDSNFAAAYSLLAVVHMAEGAVYATRSIDEAVSLAATAARKAVAHDPNDADAQGTLAFATFATGRREEAWERMSLAYACGANSPWVNGTRGVMLIWSGRPTEGRDSLLIALRLNPRDPRNRVHMGQIAVSYYFEHDYANAVEAAKHATAHHSAYPQPHRWLAAALGQLGRVTEANEALRHAVAVSPPGFDLHVRSRPRWFLPEHHEHMLEGLRKAGWRG